MKILKPVLVTLLATLLTVLTQTGGIAFLTSILTFRFIDRKFHRRWARVSAKFLSFATLYLTLSFVIVPLAAKSFGRVPLPILEERSLKPGNVWTCLLNRHYVNPELREITFKVAQRISDKYPGATVNYLDANFPFIHSPLMAALESRRRQKT